MTLQRGLIAGLLVTALVPLLVLAGVFYYLAPKALLPVAWICAGGAALVMTGLMTGMQGNLLRKLAESLSQKNARLNRAVRELGEADEQWGLTRAEVSRRVASAPQHISSLTEAVKHIETSLENLQSALGDASRKSQETPVAIELAAAKAVSGDETLRQLSGVATKVADTIKLASDLSERLNLLAINASIEAARAGDAGRGFAVVADEVKKLTAHSTKVVESLAEQVRVLQQTGDQSEASLHAVVEAVQRIRENATTVSVAVEEQASQAKRIAGSAKDTANRLQPIKDSASGVEQAMNDSSVAANQVSGAAGEVQTAFTDLKLQIQSMLDEIGRRS